MKVAMNYYKIEVMGKVMTRIINETIKKVRDMKKNIPFSIMKKKYWATLIYRKIRARKLKCRKINEEILNKRRCEA